jgi:ankyrin repeat protein
MPAVSDAIVAGDAEQLRSLLAQHPELAAERDADGVSLVRQALYRGRRDLAEIVVAADPPVDVFDAAALGMSDLLTDILEDDPSQATAWSGDGFTALHFAAFLGDVACAQLLLDAGADPAAAARGAMTVQPLHSAAAAANFDIALLLLERGAPVDARQGGGYTALHEAALRGNAALVDVLLRFGADRTIQSDDGLIAADLASRAGHKAVADRLC